MTIEENLKEYNWTPLHTRILAHRIGDGTVNVHGYYVWDNTNIKEFVELATKLEIKFWGPYQYNYSRTKKIPIAKQLQKKFAEVVNADPKELVKDRVYLIEQIKKLPREHQLQTISAIIVDDGCCTSWMLVLFEDPNKKVVEKVYELWNNLFPNTAKVKSHLTKKGNEIYHIYVNRKGIIELKKELDETIKKFGPLAGIWWKQDSLEKRYTKSINKRANQLEETKLFKEERKEFILNQLKELKIMTFGEIKRSINLSADRTRLLLSELATKKKLFIIQAGARARYSLEKEDISPEFRENIILNYIKVNQSICNRTAQKILNLGPERTGVVFRHMVKKGLIQKKGDYQKAHYMLPNLCFTTALRRPV